MEREVRKASTERERELRERGEAMRVDRQMGGWFERGKMEKRKIEREREREE